MYSVRHELFYYTSFLSFCQVLFFKVKKTFCDVVSSNANLFSIHHFFVFVNTFFQVFDTF